MNTVKLLQNTPLGTAKKVHYICDVEFVKHSMHIYHWLSDWSNLDWETHLANGYFSGGPVIGTSTQINHISCWTIAENIYGYRIITLILNSSFHKLFNCTRFTHHGLHQVRQWTTLKNSSYWLKLMANPLILVTRRGQLADDSSLYTPNKDSQMGLSGPGTLIESKL